ncbi:CLUMA_CG015962, isoform A [Clunio marinus]|uniref:CLUMA_CG015962, isoform A n=1 Tax=Clunio marinus TaxID=568069 RepID=A0A1J1ITE8_9DIPT|nr:CLUMA_CG015962, isoform A [Clunio marinus]
MNRLTADKSVIDFWKQNKQLPLMKELAFDTLNFRVRLKNLSWKLKEAHLFGLRKRKLREAHLFEKPKRKLGSFFRILGSRSGSLEAFSEF